MAELGYQQGLAHVGAYDKSPAERIVDPCKSTRAAPDLEILPMRLARADEVIG